MTGATICSGIGSAEQAAPWINWQWCAEIEPFPSELLRQRFTHANLGDITATDFIKRAKAIGPVDLIAAGTPCQAFSVAGRRESLDDERGNLTLRFVRIVDAIGPKVVLWENVPGVLGTHDNAFGCFLGALVGHPSAIVPPAGHRRWKHGKEGQYFSWPNAGMAAGPTRFAAWRVLDAQHFGVPQRRERVWLVASPRTSGIDPRKVLFEPAGVRRYSPKSRKAGQAVAGTIGNRSKGGGGLGTDFDLAGGLQPVASTLKNNHGGGGFGSDPSETFIPIPIDMRQASRGDKMTNNRHESSSGGAPGTGIGKAGDPCPSLGLSHTPAIAFNLRGREDGAQAEVSDTASVRAASGGSSRSYVAQVSETLRAGGNKTGGDRPPGTDVDTCGTLVAHALRGDGFDASEDGTGRGTPLVAENWRVRRLLPVECERLQGMPDKWTAIQFRGKPAADGPRYKAIGNSWAVPCAAWIMGRIRKEVEATR